MFFSFFFSSLLTPATSQPFLLHVKTDADEADDVSNAGFSLDYRMAMSRC